MSTKLLLIAFLMVLCVTPCRSESNTQEALLLSLKNAAKGTNSLVSNFEQEKYLNIFAEKIKSDGRFVYQIPDRLRWELLTPVSSGFVLRGGSGVRWNHLSNDIQDFSVERDPVMGMIAQQLLAWARIDVEWLSARYRMEQINEQPLRLKLTPLDEGEAAFIAYLEVHFAEDLSYVTDVLMFEEGGDSTRLHFTDVEINGDVPEDAFTVPGQK